MTREQVKEVGERWKFTRDMRAYPYPGEIRGVGMTFQVRAGDEATVIAIDKVSGYCVVYQMAGGAQFRLGPYLGTLATFLGMGLCSHNTEVGKPCWPCHLKAEEDVATKMEAMTRMEPRRPEAPRFIQSHSRWDSAIGVFSLRDEGALRRR